MSRLRRSDWGDVKAGEIPLHIIYFLPAQRNPHHLFTTPQPIASKMSKAEENLEILRSTVKTASALITQLQTPATAKEDVNQVNALDLAHDTASLIRAHSTKLSLLIINKPFTASAVTTVLRELVSGPLPGLASAVELCDDRKYTKAMSEELRYQAGKVFTELKILVAAIPLDGKILSDEAKNGTGSTKGSLAMTGTVWQACDAVIELKNIGIAGLVVRKAEQYRATLKDALEELQEWGEEQSDEEDAYADSEDDAQAAADTIFGSQRHIPIDDPEKIRPRLESSLKRLRLLGLMYQAVVKRRFKTLPTPPGPRVVSCLDDILGVLKKIPDIADELASAFYELDEQEIDKLMDQCFFTGFAAVELLIKNWEGQEDEFSSWVSWINRRKTSADRNLGSQVQGCHEEGGVI